MTDAEIIVRALLENEDEDDFKEVVGDPPQGYSDERRLRNMRFRSKDEVNIGTKVLYRIGPSGWDKKSDAHYKITGSDWYHVSAFWRCPPGRRLEPHSCQRLKPEQKHLSTHISIYGVCGANFTWEEFFAQCVKPELYYPHMKMKGMPFNVAPDRRH